MLLQALFLQASEVVGNFKHANGLFKFNYIIYHMHKVKLIRYQYLLDSCPPFGILVDSCVANLWIL